MPSLLPDRRATPGGFGPRADWNALGQEWAIDEELERSRQQIARKYRGQQNATLPISDAPAPPSTQRGALFATMTEFGSIEDSDILFFSRYPTDIGIKLEANIASADVAGRSFPAYQVLGGKGQTISLNLFFYDAFLDRQNPQRAQRSLAATAQMWFNRYVINPDADGMMGDVPYVYFKLGGGPVVRVLIQSVDSTLSIFDWQDRPQRVDAKVALTIHKPLELISPFRPRSPVAARHRQLRSPRVTMGAPIFEILGGGGMSTAADPGSAGARDFTSRTSRSLEGDELMANQMYSSGLDAFLSVISRGNSNPAIPANSPPAAASWRLGDLFAKRTLR